MAEVTEIASVSLTEEASPSGKTREGSLASKVTSSGALSLSSTDAGSPNEVTSPSRCFSSSFLASDEEEDGVVGISMTWTEEAAADAEERGDIGTAKLSLQLLASAFQIPHPEKVGHGGEDSFFIAESGAAMGVADGVSEWGWRFDMNPRVFSDELMAGAQTAAEQGLRAERTASAEERAASAMSFGHASVKAFGSATALVLVLNSQSAEAGVANLGDSGLRQFRRSSAQRMEVVGQTKEQLHEFNRPFQLSRVPRPEDFPRLLAEGKKTLVQVVKRCKPYTPDMPSDADLYTFKVEAGDLFVLGSDGLFDNLHDAELCEIINDGMVSASNGEEAQPPAAPQDLAKRLAEAASRKSVDRTSTTPFSQSATAAGFDYAGGIQDDITVVVAQVVRA